MMLRIGRLVLVGGLALAVWGAATAPQAAGAKAPSRPRFLSENEANEPTIQIDYQKVIVPLIAAKTSAFIATCHTRNDHDRIIMVFPVGSPKGFYGVFEKSGFQDQGADISLSGDQVKVDEFMGGIGLVEYQTKVVKGLLRSPFTLVPPERLKYAFLSQPVTRQCTLWNG